MRSDQGSVQPRILPPTVASSRCSEQRTEETGPVPRGLYWCPCCAPSAQWSQGFLSRSCSWTTAFDGHQWPGPLRICLIPFEPFYPLGLCSFLWQSHRHEAATLPVKLILPCSLFKPDHVLGRVLVLTLQETLNRLFP